MARACRDDLPDGQSEEFFRRGLDSANQFEKLRQIRVLAQVLESEFRRAKSFFHHSTTPTTPSDGGHIAASGSTGVLQASQWKSGPYSVCTTLKPSGTDRTVGVRLPSLCDKVVVPVFVQV